MMPQLSIDIDSDIFNIIQPPQQYPPTMDYLTQQNDKHFITQCKKFLNKQKSSYTVSKKMQFNLKKILNSNKQLQEMVIKKDTNSQKIYKEIEKLNQNRKLLEKRQQTLEMICNLVKLENLKGMLLFQAQRSISQQLIDKMKRKPQSQKSIASQTQISKPASEQEKRVYLDNLVKIYQVVNQSGDIQQSLNNQKLPLIESILTQIHQLFANAIDKALSAQMLTPDMIQLILTQYYQPFLFDSDLYVCTKKSPKQKFTQIMVANRLQKYRLQLNPIINNLNYASNVIDLYDSILQTWVRIIDEDLKLFTISNQTEIVKLATKMILNEAMPKLQKNTYKMKQMRQICYIRFKINQFLQKLNSIQLLQDKQNITQQKWQPLPSMIQKMRIFLQAKIIQQSQRLSTTKYNIYSLASYIPVREYLETIKQCIQYDFERPPDLEYNFNDDEQDEKVSNSPTTNNNNKKSNSQKYLDWQQPFYNLAISRKPQSQPNNKSLVIFNLNIWYLYLKIIKQPSHKLIAVETMLWCKQKFIEMNIKQCSKTYYESLDKVLQLCGNIPVFRNVLYAEINMLGHEDLRKQIAEGIKEKYLLIYSHVLSKVGKQSMNNQQVKQFCKQNKINLNKFGKFSSQICIYSIQELKDLINYS